MKIRTKLMILFICLTVIPISLLGFMVINDIDDMKTSAIENVNVIKDTAIEDSNIALNNLGEKAIELTANAVAKQLEIYIMNNPEKTLEDLQNDEFFQSIAVQPVGDTGYTAITDVDSLVCRFHASAGVVNLDLHNLAEKLPGFWGVMSKTQGGVVASGLYDWAEADGTINEKYMHIAILNVRTADGVLLSVAATTYLSEFNYPAKVTSDKLIASANAVATDVDQTSESIRKKSFLLISVMTIIALIITIIFTKGIIKPLNDLKKAAIEVAEGNLDAKVPVIKTKDEVQDIGEAVILLIGAVKFLKKDKKK